ncbi:MAG TPA: ADP-ribosylglycohydrolase family protein, partial [Candidatus Pelethocola excrementipullorum]|nr:ADP-ribosylglycohydrolase family protein [Candidatus Pelethocola excrementipullorum]
KIEWLVPDVGGHAIYRLGIRLTCDYRLDGFVVVKTLDWSDAPVEYRMGKSMEMTPSLTPWTTQTAWLKTFVSSADHFNPDYTVTFSVCNAVENGVVTTGTADWKDYSVESIITFSQQDAAGLVARAKGHRRYYGAVFTEGYAVIYRQMNNERKVIAKQPFAYEIDSTYKLRFEVDGVQLTLYVDDKKVVEGQDFDYSCGQAGFVVDEGAILGDGFIIKALK